MVMSDWRLVILDSLMVNRIPYNTNIVANLIRLLCHTQGMDDDQAIEIGI